MSGTSSQSAPARPVATQTIPRSGVQILALDGIRGIAILMVIVFHFALHWETESSRAIDRAVTHIAFGGWPGVDLFFVLSGFLITGILIDAKQASQHFFRNFYGRRTLRIFPLYFGFLILLFLLLPLLQPMENDIIDELRGHQYWYWFFFSNVRQTVQPDVTADMFVAGHLWSLAVEEQFYLLWPSVVLFLNRRALQAACVAIVIVALALRIGLTIADVPVHTLLPTRMDTLALGALVAIIARGPGGAQQLLRWAKPVGFLSVGILVGIVLWTHESTPFHPLMQTAGLSALAFLSAALIVYGITAAPGTRFHVFLTNRILVWLGVYSYGLYVFHRPIAALLQRRLDIAESTPMIAGSGIPGMLFFSLVAGALAVLFAWLSRRLWENQFLKLKGRFPYHAGEVPKK